MLLCRSVFETAADEAKREAGERPARARRRKRKANADAV